MFFRDSSRDYQPARRSDPGRAGSRPEDRRYAASSRPEAEAARKLSDKREDKRAPPRRVRERVFVYRVVDPFRIIKLDGTGLGSGSRHVI